MYGGFEDARESAPRTRHDPIYGVFMESDSDSDNDGSRRRKRCKGASDADLSKPVMFVSAGNALPSSQGPERARKSDSVSTAGGANEEEEEEDDIDPLPTSFGKMISDGTRARREQKERDATAARRRQASGQPAPALGSVRANATVANIMRGMGYEPGKGLGKHGQGIAEPVEVPVRPKNAGLGSVEKPKPVMSASKENLPPPSWPSAAPASSTTEPQHHQRWWKKKASGSKAPVLTKHEVLAKRAERAEQPAVVVQKVLDMRGPQPRVLTTLDRLNDAQEMAASADDAPLPELQHNARLLVDEAEADVVTLDGRLRREREKAASLAREKESLTTRKASQRRQLQAMETIAGTLEQAGALDLGGLLRTFQGLKARFGEDEFKACGVAWIASRFAHPLLLRAFHGWRPLQDPSFGLQAVSAWKDLLLEADHHPHDFGVASMMAPYARLVSEVVLPAVRNAGTNSWDARDAEPMLRLLATWEEALPPVVLRSIIEHVVVPKLSAAVDSWDPRGETVPPIHAWVHPWLDVLDQRSVQTLCHSVRCRMGSALQAWQAHDASSAHALLSPWKDVFDPAIWNDLLARYVVPKLKTALQEFQINLADQKLDQFHWVMTWASEIPSHLMVRILETDFFGKWQYVLYRWLCSPNPDFNEIINWYEGWKGMFPPELLADECIRAHLAAGLGMMNQAAEGLEVVQPGCRGGPSILRATSEERQELDAAQLHCQIAEPGADTADLSFKECIQAFAIDKGFLFMPRVGKFYSGMPVYEFGATNICIDSVKRVVYARLLNQMGRPRCYTDAGAASTAVKDDPTAVAADTSNNRSGYMSFTLSPTPKVSYLDLHWPYDIPDAPAGLSASTSFVSVDENLLLIRIDQYPRGSDLFVYTARAPSPPSLRRLPACDKVIQGLAGRSRFLELVTDIGILHRGDVDDYVVADLTVSF
ncbi:hypothetical protein PR202_gb04565 [Eleusine coracana subsp. coracana]|uniref:G-patch domain-containing protein n=1 Tax=Eleusine coracana subsp. coracana TaxID=191504 RepID=A0AAV5E4W1_ELECO|nr:hypothetical protein PR202_gb04565 [Eleusine coracana subsp. coracana]